MLYEQLDVVIRVSMLPDHTVNSVACQLLGHHDPFEAPVQLCITAGPWLPGRSLDQALEEARSSILDQLDRFDQLWGEQLPLF